MLDMVFHLYCSSQIVLRQFSVHRRSIFQFITMDTVPAAAPGVRSASNFICDKAFINGQWVSAKSGATYEVTNPANGRLINSVPDMTSEDAEDAVVKANAAYEKWRTTTAKHRSNILRKWFEISVQHREELAKLITAEHGKPLKDALAEIDYSNAFIEWYSEEARRVYGDIISSPVSTKRMMVMKQPIGVCGMITPWNFPAAMITRKACAAIAAGCTVVLKPAEDTPLSALAICELSKEAGLPDGVLNVVTCSKANAKSVGQVLCTSPTIRKLSFTGSTATGKILLAQTASTVKKVSLELGGNAPFIVFDSANIESACQGAMVCKFRCSGQSCVCANRILVQAGVYDKFVARFSELIKAELKVGDGFDPETTQGPLINIAAVNKVDDLVKDAVKNGAKIVHGGQRSDQGVNYYEPTLLTGVKAEMRCAQEEIFGPVAAVIKFDTEEEVLRIANSSRTGLAAYVYSNDLSQIWRVTEKLEVGMCGINEGLISCVEGSFGGAKESGFGREGSKYGIEEYIQQKYVCMGGI